VLHAVSTPLRKACSLLAIVGMILSFVHGPAMAGPTTGIDLSPRAVMELPAPPVQKYKARDGGLLAYRYFEPKSGEHRPAVVAILLHGSSGSSLNMTVLGDALAKSGVPVFAPDARGQGLSGRRGDIDYIGQLDDDLADLISVVRKTYPDARLVLVGHSAGGGFALRIAGEAEGHLFSRFVLLSPVLGRLAPTPRPGVDWARPHTGRIVFLTVLNAIGITALNGETAVDFNLPPDTDDLGLTRSWSYRMMMNYGPRGQTQLFGRPGYLVDAARAPAPIVVIAGADDEQFFAHKYALAFEGLAKPVSVELVPGVGHMGVLSDPHAVSTIVAAVKRED
jgi:pimeloyl-ACP methyl ester carboxylesterase